MNVKAKSSPGLCSGRSRPPGDTLLCLAVSSTASGTWCGGMSGAQTEPAFGLCSGSRRGQA